jgi:predicted esterase YcpF (UPF0227 family)
MYKEIKVIYLHGYGSSSASDKVTGLKQFFWDVYAPDIPIFWDEAEELLLKFVSEVNNSDSRPTVVVGTSLGGYWATRMADHFGLPSVIINPSCTPASSLRKYPDCKLSVKELLKYVPLQPVNASARTVLLSMDDEVLNPDIAKMLFSPFADVIEYPKMGHRFESINIIRDNILETANLDYLSDDNI